MTKLELEKRLGEIKAQRKSGALSLPQYIMLRAQALFDLVSLPTYVDQTYKTPPSVVIPITKNSSQKTRAKRQRIRQRLTILHIAMVDIVSRSSDPIALEIAGKALNEIRIDTE